MASEKTKESLEGVKMAYAEVENQKEAIASVPPLGNGIDEEQVALFRKFTTADPEFHRKLTKTLTRKVDFHLMPMIALMFMLNFLDRNNLSQARLGTLEKDLGMTGTDFNLATSILFVGYLLMQLPSNLLLTRVRPSLYLGAAMTIWGTISAAQAATRNFASLVVCRFFLGLSEAPFFPGAMLLMSSWYTRPELALRIAWFYCGHSFANAFGGLLGAGVLANLSGSHGIAGWRWLFIIEGTLTIGSAMCSTLILPDYPATTRWLSTEERAYAQWRLVKEVGEADAPGASTIKDGVMLALRDPRLYLFTLLQHASLLTQTFQYFFPTILQTLGYGNIETLLLTAPVWAFTFFSSLVVTYTSGRFSDRSIHIICLIMISCAGNIIAVATLNTAARFFALFLLPLGALPAYQILLAWVANSFPRPLVKRSVCISFTNMIGNTANIYGTYMYPSVDGPRYLAGGAATAGVALLVVVLTLVARFELQRQNRKLDLREEFESGGTTAQPRDPEEAEAAPVGFRYTL
ncbi:putative MFS transporter [Annulohypoxylon moriforme]|nr:putative MFS transporter [Annulohypoxylon moriforme]